MSKTPLNLIYIILIAIFNFAYPYCAANEIDFEQEAADIAKKIENGEGDKEFSEAFYKDTESREQGKQEQKKYEDWLNSLDPNDLETAGRSAARDKSEVEKNNLSEVDKTQSEMREFELDANDKRLNIHKDDINDIVEASSETLVDTLKAFKERDIDCYEEAGKNKNRGLPYLKIKKKETIEDTVYDKVLCERLKNKYDCRSTLQLKCKNPNYVSSQSFKILSVNGGIPTNYTNGVWALGWGDTRVFDGGRGAIFDYSIDFSINDLQTVTNFVLESIGYDDLVLIKLNNNYVYSGPFGGDKLEPAPSPYPSSFFDFNYVNIGSQVVSMEQWHWRGYNPNINLKPFLKSGNNTLTIRLAVGGRGGLFIKMKVDTKTCAEHDWVQSWEETCSHITAP
ncbi:MAG: hypothetical protein K0R02_709 [Rickettsiaceae bacterium]|jgi:hypothetical protein|nr:hypothetical protein [Rickettsiaceae bacterium]